MRVVISRAAAFDLQAAQRWLTQPGSGFAAREKLSHLRHAIRELRRNSGLWPAGDFTGTREASIVGYRIVYEIHARTDEVKVLRVFGPGQDRTRL